jgi:hypothetical protein
VSARVKDEQRRQKHDATTLRPGRKDGQAYAHPQLSLRTYFRHMKKSLSAIIACGAVSLSGMAAAAFAHARTPAAASDQTAALCAQQSSVPALWRPVGAAAGGTVHVEYCVAPLAGQDSATQVVWFSLLGRGDDVDRQAYTFVVHTSLGRVLRQGPAVIQVEPKTRHSCRMEICEFLTLPGEKVVAVGFTRN